MLGVSFTISQGCRQVNVLKVGLSRKQELCTKLGLFIAGPAATSDGHREAVPEATDRHSGAGPTSALPRYPGTQKILLKIR